MWRWARGAPWGRGPPWGRGDPPEGSGEPLEICLALARRLFDLGALCCLGAARAALRAVGAGRLLAAAGLGGAAGAWLQGLAAFLLEESVLEESDRLRITHERIANHLGTAREVVTRMLRYFQSEGMVRLARGTIELLDKEKLEQLSAAGRPERSEGTDR